MDKAEAQYEVITDGHGVYRVRDTGHLTNPWASHAFVNRAEAYALLHSLEHPQLDPNLFKEGMRRAEASKSWKRADKEN